MLIISSWYVSGLSLMRLVWCCRQQMITFLTLYRWWELNIRECGLAIYGCPESTNNSLCELLLQSWKPVDILLFPPLWAIWKVLMNSHDPAVFVYHFGVRVWIFKLFMFVIISSNGNLIAKASNWRCVVCMQNINISIRLSTGTLVHSPRDESDCKLFWTINEDLMGTLVNKLTIHSVWMGAYLWCSSESEQSSLHRTETVSGSIIPMRNLLSRWQTKPW